MPTFSRNIFVLLCILAVQAALSPFFVRAQHNTRTDTPAYQAMMSAKEPALFIPEGLADAVETSYTWRERQYLHIDTFCISDYDPKPTPDSVYIMRLRALPTQIDMPFNEPIRQALDLYLMRRRNLIERMVGIGYNHYFPIFEDALQRYGLPSELKYLACIESGLRQNAYSPARAAGLWQFIPSTGILQGLEVNSYIDERYDLYKSTDAACRFLKQLYNKFQDWHLAIAAYNCGPGNIDKAIARSGGRRTFWELYSLLPRETRSYVPLFIAATYVMTYHCEHNLCGTLTNIPVECDTVMLSRMVHFEQIAQCLQMPIEQIESLNPQYTSDIVPASAERRYSITLPADKAMEFAQWEDSIIVYKADSLLPHNGDLREVVEKGRRNSYVQSGGNRDTRASGGKGGKGKRGSASSAGSHTVRKGDTLAGIARKYGISVAQLKSANRIKGDNIRIGQRLRIP